MNCPRFWVWVFLCISSRWESPRYLSGLPRGGEAQSVAAAGPGAEALDGEARAAGQGQRVHEEEVRRAQPHQVRGAAGREQAHALAGLPQPPHLERPVPVAVCGPVVAVVRHQVVLEPAPQPGPQAVPDVAPHLRKARALRKCRSKITFYLKKTFCSVMNIVVLFENEHYLSFLLKKVVSEQ